jgi:hypothetical protein
MGLSEQLQGALGEARETVPFAIYRTYTADYTTQIEWAHDKEGRWYKRFQERHPRYGYRWGRWKFSPSAPRLASTHPSSPKKARLPKR